jgi:hypothetical protein
VIYIPYTIAASMNDAKPVPNSIPVIILNMLLLSRNPKFWLNPSINIGNSINIDTWGEIRKFKVNILAPSKYPSQIPGIVGTFIAAVALAWVLVRYTPIPDDWIGGIVIVFLILGIVAQAVNYWKRLRQGY